jgi:hypothetical protein
MFDIVSPLLMGNFPTQFYQEKGTKANPEDVLGNWDKWKTSKIKGKWLFPG